MFKGVLRIQFISENHPNSILIEKEEFKRRRSCQKYSEKLVNHNVTVRPLFILSAVLGRTKFWPQKPQIIDI